MLEETPQENQSELYDARAIQRQTFTVDDDGDKFDTIHVWNPLEDDRFFDFDADCKTIIADEGETVSTERLEASAKLFDDQIVDIEGFEGERPDNWKSLIDPVSEKMPSVNTFLAALPIEPEKSSGNKRYWGTESEKPVILEVHFNYPAIVQTKHFIRKKTIADGKSYEKLQKIPIGGKRGGLKSGADMVLTSQAREKVKLYDQMKTREAEGYNSRVPAWHKVAVIDYVFRSAMSKK